LDTQLPVALLQKNRFGHFTDLHKSGFFAFLAALRLRNTSSAFRSLKTVFANAVPMMLSTTKLHKTLINIMCFFCNIFVVTRFIVKRISNPMSVVLARDFTHSNFISHSTKEIVFIFVLSALSYMIGVAWYEAARATINHISERYKNLSALQWTYLYTLVMTVTILLVAILIHYIMRVRKHAEAKRA